MDRPHLRFIDAGPMAPTPSIAAATAPARAMGEFGRALEGLGDRGFQIATQIRETDEAGKLSAWRTNADERANQFSNSLLTRHDPANWAEDWAATSRDIGAEIDGLDLSPVAKQRARQEFDEWSSAQGNRLSTQAAMRVVSEGKARVSNSIAYYAARGDDEGVRREAKRGRDAGFLSPVDEEEVLRDADRIAATSEIERQIAENPKAMAERLTDPDFIANQPGLTLADQARLEQQARGRYREDLYNITQEVADGIVTGTLNSPEKIEQKYGTRVSPAILESFKADLANRADANHRALIASPAYQASTVAKVGEMLDSYSVDMEGFDEKFVEMDSMVRSLPPGAVKTELSRRLTAVRDGQVRVLETQADYHRQALDDLTKAGAFGTATTRRPVSDFVRAGMLKDVAKLEKTGIPVETAREIAKEIDPRKQVAKLKEALAEAGKEGGYLDTNKPFDSAVFNALVKGEGFVEVEDLAAKEKARRAAGLAKTKLEEWLRLHPEATEQQGREALLRITGETAIPGMVDQILETPPAWGDGSGGDVLPEKPAQ